MRSTKRFLTILTILTLCLTLLTVSAFAADEVASGTCGENLTWTLDSDGTLTISGSGYMYEGSQWHDYCSSITSVVLPDGLTNIGNFAFDVCENLNSIVIPNTVTSIGDESFYGCSGLTSITIPQSVATIGRSAFAYCSSLASITISEGVTSIDIGAFSNCSSLTSITIPGSVVSVGDYAFPNCKSLSSVVISEGVTSIGDDAFFGCTSLTTVDLPEGVTSIGERTFAYCSNLTTIEIPKGVTSIGDHTFAWAGLTSVVLPESLTSIADNVFYACMDLTSIVIPKGITSIGNSAFYYCSDLSDVFYSGSEEDWAQISIGTENEHLTSATIHYNWNSNCAHEYTSAVTAPTCTQNGSTTHTCAVCDYYYIETIPATGHKYESVVTAPTCIKDGYTTHTCSGCGDSYTDTEVPTTGHDFGEAGVCTGCGALIEIVINMTDTYGDGWGGNAIEVYEDGILLEAITIVSGSTGSYSTPYYGDKVYTFKWVKGSWAEECTFDITLNGEVLHSAATTDCKDYPGGEVFFTLCNHSYDDVVTKDATCTENGGIFYTCIHCGDTYVEQEVITSGHSIGADGVCTVCGYAGEIVINITDSYGDGWNDNAIEVYEDGTLIFTATMTTGNSASFSIPRFNGKTYTFQWVIGSYPGECSFEIVINDETAFSATTNDCEKLGNGQLIYKLCNHTYGEGVQTDPTCTDKGGLVYTCTACGSKRIENEIPALGHTRENGVCIVCGAPPEIIASGDCGDSITWKLDTEGVLTFSGTGEIPDTEFFSYPAWYYACAETTVKLVIEEGITTIGSAAFMDFTKLRVVELADSVTTLDMNAFSGTGIFAMEIPKNVDTIRVMAFANCYNLCEFTVHPENTHFVAKDGVLFSADTTKLVAFPIGAPLNIYEMPDTVTHVEGYAFSEATGLTEIIYSKNLVSIDDEAFHNCTGLTKLELPEGMDYIGGGAFQGCENIETITLPTTLTKICALAFEGTAYYLDRNNWVDGVLYIGNYCITGMYMGYDIDGESIYEGRGGHIDIRPGTTLIAGEAFSYYGDDDIVAVTLPSSLRYINWYAFCGTDIASVTIGNNVEWIGEGAFWMCDYLNEVNLGSGIKRIGENAFDDTPYIENEENYIDGFLCNGKYLLACNGDIGTNIVIPEGIELIADFAIANCGTYTNHTVSFPESLKYIGKDAFVGTMLTDVTIPSTVLEIGDYAIGYLSKRYNDYDGYYIYTTYYDVLIQGVKGSAAERYAKACGFAFGCRSHTYDNACDADCNVCGDTRDASHTYDGTHDPDCNNCGTANPDYVLPLPTIQPAAAGLAFKDEIHYNAYFTVENPGNAEIVEMGLLTWTSEIDGNLENAENVLPGAVEEGGILKVRSQPIPAKNMGDTVYMKVYLKLADGTYIYSELLNYSAKVYAANMLDNEKTDASIKALCVAMLNYGAAAQDYFGYKTDDLMNADLTDEQKALVSGYNEDMIPALNSAETDIVCNGGFKSMTASVNFGGALGINYIFKPAKAMDGEMKLYVWTSADEALSFENASQVLTTEERAGKYTARVGAIAARNAGETIYVCGVYESDGVQYSTGVLAYSVSAYCKALASTSGAFQPMAQAAAVYAYYANICLN